MGNSLVFACARIRANERYLLNKEKLNQMVEAKTLEDACKVLQDAQYGEEGAVIQPLEYEKTLVKESQKMFTFLHSLAPDADEFRIFAYSHDYHNIKLLIKAEALHIPADSLQLTGGTLPAQAMKLSVLERDYAYLTPHMRVAIEESLDTLARTRDPQVVDLICDRECYKDIVEAAAKSKSKFVKGYVQLMIDTINLKTFVRCRKMGQTWNYFSTVYLQGGSITEKTFVAGYDEPLQQFAARIASSPLASAVEEGSAAIRESGSFTTIEKMCDDALIKYVKDAKYISFGIEPLIGYAVGKQMEIKSVRIIMAAKIVGLPADLIRERLRETYG